MSEDGREVRGTSSDGSLEPSPEEMRRIGYRAVDFLVDFLAGLGESPVADLRSTPELSERIREELPEAGRGVEDSLEKLGSDVVPFMTRVTHPRFHAYIPCPGSFHGALGMLLAGGLNPFTGSSLGAASFSAFELETLRWVAEAVGYRRDAEGIFTSGGSMANLGALAAAAAVSSHGRAGQVYLSDQGHASMEKAARVLGFGPEQITALPTDEDLRIDLAAARTLLERDHREGRPLFLCANAGTTNTGVVDPLHELANLCAEHDVWFHVDAAYGGFAAISDHARPLFTGMERADSLTLDPHKWLYSPMGHGCLLVRREGALAAAFSASGDYLRDVDRAEVNFFDRGPELSRPTRALPVWLLMRSVGLEGLRAAIDKDLELAGLAESLLREEPAFRVVSRHLSIVCFRLVGRPGEDEEARGEREKEIVRRLVRGGDALVSGTTLRGRGALRLVVMNHRTQEGDVRRSVKALREVAAVV